MMIAMQDLHSNCIQMNENSVVNWKQYQAWAKQTILEQNKNKKWQRHQEHLSGWIFVSVDVCIISADNLPLAECRNLNIFIFFVALVVASLF